MNTKIGFAIKLLTFNRTEHISHVCVWRCSHANFDTHHSSHIKYILCINIVFTSLRCAANGRSPAFYLCVCLFDSVFAVLMHGTHANLQTTAVHTSLSLNTHTKHFLCLPPNHQQRHITFSIQIAWHFLYFTAEAEQKTNKLLLILLQFYKKFFSSWIFKRKEKIKFNFFTSTLAGNINRFVLFKFKMWMNI